MRDIRDSNMKMVSRRRQLAVDLTVQASTFYFNARSATLYWETSPDNMVDGDTSTRAKTEDNHRIQELTGNTSLAVPDSIIFRVELRSHAFGQSGNRGMYIIPLFGGLLAGSTYNYTGIGGTWSAYVDITSDANAPVQWDWDDVANLDVRIATPSAGSGTNVSKVELRVSYWV